MFRRVLIANRGEIAIRIARAASALGIETVSVYSRADEAALHTKLTHHSVALPDAEGGGAVGAYLSIEGIVHAALTHGCDAIHPGYGFLSENAEFARRCAGAGLRFIGPSPAALDLFGDKVQARQFAQSLGVPIINGSEVPLGSPDEARTLAQAIGYPAMLKAAAGGGGRGMRRVLREEDLAESFQRCQSEAEAAFGDGSVFLEKLIAQPRHIEVQVVGDATGKVVHLRERDCSVQLRHQKVVEVAPAPNLEGDLRERILEQAVALIRAAEYENVGTVEFLVDPESRQHHFIECNPRIQVEHTITEQVLGLDLVEIQFRIAAGANLDDLGLGQQASVPVPRGYAVQARVVAQSTGTLVAYREPSGPGVRVDGCGYVGLTPSPHFDPLLAKVIGQASETQGFVAAVDRTLRALDEFHVGGIETNIAQLRAILTHPRFRAGDARTTLLDEAMEQAVREAPSPARTALRFLDQQAQALRGRETPGRAPQAPLAAALPVPEGHFGVESPHEGTLVQLVVQAGARVAAGDPLLVISAMKMETTIASPVAGVVTAVLSVKEGQSIGSGQVVAAVRPDEAAQASTVPVTGDEGWGKLLGDVDQLRGFALARLAPGSKEPGVVRQRSRGKLTCRERIDRLLDPGSFREIGSLAGFASYDEFGQVADFTPANHVGGLGKVEGRSVIVCADDFTSRGGHADGAIGQKSRYLDALSIEMRMPSMRLLDGSSGGGSVATMVPKQQAETRSAKESQGAITAGRPRVTGSGGSFLPGHLGSSMYADQLSKVPVVNLLLGSVVGIGAAKAVLGHFSVMVRDIAQLFVAGPPVVAHAMGVEVTKEELGGWHIHCRNGSVDNLAESEDEAFEMGRRFLSYLPSSVYECPPRCAPGSDDPVDRREEELFTLIPRKRSTTFDVRRGIRLMADHDSFFEIGPLWGTDQVVGFARFDGYPVGVIASDSRHANGGALTADGCDKLRRHLDVCDLFHLPVLNLIDNPGFAVGVEHEVAGTIRKGGEWMIAFAQVAVPIFTVIMRRSFGVAGNNYATPRSRVSRRVIWPASDAGGIPPEGGIEAAYKRQLAEAADPQALRAEINARIESARGPIGPLNRFEMEEMIDPRDTRRLVCEWLTDAYRVANDLARLGPRALQFRP